MLLTVSRCFSRYLALRSYWESAERPPIASLHRVSCPRADSVAESM